MFFTSFAATTTIPISTTTLPSNALEKTNSDLKKNSDKWTILVVLVVENYNILPKN